MLVLSRKQGERLNIGDDVTITVLEVRGRRVRLGIKAPDHVHVMRAELCQWDDGSESHSDGRQEELIAG
jgi:carbon storage regulator